MGDRLDSERSKKRIDFTMMFFFLSSTFRIPSRIVPVFTCDTTKDIDDWSEMVLF